MSCGGCTVKGFRGINVWPFFFSPFFQLDWNSRAAQHSLPQWLSRLCISSRFIGQLCFGPNFEADESDCLPEWPPGALPLIR